MGRYNGYPWGAVTQFTLGYSSDGTSSLTNALSGGSSTLSHTVGGSYSESTIITLDKPVTGTRFRFTVLNYAHWPSMMFDLYTTSCIPSPPPSPPSPPSPPPNPPPAYDVSKMVAMSGDHCNPLTGGTRQAGFFCVNLIGGALKTTAGVWADTGSWDLNLPLSCVDMSKVTILSANITGAWGLPAHYVSGEIGMQSVDGQTNYTAQVGGSASAPLYP